MPIWNFNEPSLLMDIKGTLILLLIFPIKVVEVFHKNVFLIKLCNKFSGNVNVAYIIFVGSKCIWKYNAKRYKVWHTYVFRKVYVLLTGFPTLDIFSNLI